MNLILSSIGFKMIIAAKFTNIFTTIITTPMNNKTHLLKMPNSLLKRRKHLNKLL